MVGLLVVPPGLSLALSGLPFGSQLAVSGTPVRGCVLFSWEVACTWISLGSLAWWLRSSVRPWVWRHPVASVEVDLSVRPGPKMLEPLIGLAQHNVREGWRAWVWKKYSPCGRHEVKSLPVSDQTFPSLDIKNTRSWILSSPVAATVGLGATFSPGTYSRIPSSSRSSACPWGCGGVGFWEHITWECPYRLGPFPPKPSCPFLARFGWAQKTSCPNEVLKVRCWLAKCQDSIWNTKESGN